MGFSLGKAVGGYVTGGITGMALPGGIFNAKNDAPANRIPRLSDIPKNQTVLDLEKQLKEIPAVTPISAYQAKKIEGPLPEFDLAREKLKKESSVSGQAGSEALARRFAALGGGPSGAFIKQAEIQNENLQNRTAEGLREIGVQEASARRQLQQAEDDKAFQSGEATKQFNAQQAFQDRVFRFDSASKLGQLDLGYKAAELNAATEAYNADLNSYTARKTGGLFGAGGFLGLGIGN